MKRILSLALIAVALSACEDKIEHTSKDKFEFGEPMGNHMELIETDGHYAPKADITSMEMFNYLFNGVWKLNERHFVLTSGQMDSAPMPVDEAKPLFAVKPDGVIRQYIYSKESQEKFYKDGTYSYDPTTGVLTLDGLTDMPAELRIIILTNEKMTGTSWEENCAVENYALTHCGYEKLAVDQAVLDIEYSEELP